jgi:hypothetical protein
MAMIAALKRCTTQNLTDDRSAKALRHPKSYDGQFSQPALRYPKSDNAVRFSANCQASA